MKFTGLVVATVLLAALPHQPGTGPATTPATPGLPAASTPLTPSATEPQAAPVRPGDPAPAVTFQTADGASLTLRDLLEQGHALLVFAPGDDALRALQQERARLLDLGVVPVAVLDARAGAARARRARLGLTFVVASDARRIVASQFNLVDDAAQRVAPSWFVVDRGGRVRALRRNHLPDGGWPGIAAAALGLPASEVALPTRTR